MTLIQKGKPISEMTDREILTELLEEKRRGEDLRRVKWGAADTLKENAALWKESGGEALQSAVTGLNDLLERMPKVFH